MFDTIYIEEDVRCHPRTQQVLERFPDSRQIYCARYTEVFNRKSQNFRLQKLNPALILARKQKKLVLPAPDEYGLGEKHNYYFSHMLNCIYDCRYCFLQGMYRSAHYVLFVNYEEFGAEIKKQAKAISPGKCYFFRATTVTVLLWNLSLASPIFFSL